MSAAVIKEISHAQDEIKLVTIRIDQQLFGIPVHHVRDVLREQKVAPVPLARPEIAGSINLRGRIVTVVDMRQRLGLAPRHEKAPSMFVVVEHRHELYSLKVDSVGEVLDAPAAQVEHQPANLDGAWSEISSGIWQLKEELLLILDVAAVLKL